MSTLVAPGGEAVTRVPPKAEKAYPAFSKWMATFERLAGSRPIVYGLFALVYLVPSLYLASVKLFWDDEFFTLYLSRITSWHELLRALGTGADQHPPSFYYVTHGFLQLFGSTHVALRLPEILGYGLLCVCLYEIVRLYAAPIWAVLGMLFPLSTHLYMYAVEARAYGLVCGFSALALLAWMKATDGQRRTVYVPLLGLALAAGVASHYYAVMVALCLGVSELVRTALRRRIDWPIWAALACTVLPLVAFFRTIHSARGYSTHFWAVPTWTDTFKFYTMQIALGAVGIVGAVAMLLCLDRSWRGGRGQEREPSVTDAGALPVWWSVAICFMSLLPFVVMILAKFVTHGFSDRYTIGAIVGISALVPWFLSRVARQPRYAMAALATALVLFWYQAHDLHGEFDAGRQETAVDIMHLNDTGAQTVVVADITRFHRLSFYAPRALASRLVYVSDPAASIEYLGHDTVDRGLMDLRPWFPLRVEPHLGFLKSHQNFLVYGSVSRWSWLTFRMPAWGDSRLLLRDSALSQLFAMHLKEPATAAPLTKLGDDALVDSQPMTGPSLCTIYMGAARCKPDAVKESF